MKTQKDTQTTDPALERLLWLYGKFAERGKSKNAASKIMAAGLPCRWGSLKNISYGATCSEELAEAILDYKMPPKRKRYKRGKRYGFYVTATKQERATLNRHGLTGADALRALLQVAERMRDE